VSKNQKVKDFQKGLMVVADMIILAQEALVEVAVTFLALLLAVAEVEIWAAEMVLTPVEDSNY
jgi:hypothetical protein